MMGVVGHVDEALDVVDVVVLFLWDGGLTEALVLSVVLRQDGGAREVDPEARLVGRVACGNAFGDGRCAGDAVCGVGGIYDDVGLGCRLFNNRRVIKRAVDKVDIRVLLLDGSGALLAPHKERVMVIRMRFVDGIKGRPANIASCTR